MKRRTFLKIAGMGSISLAGCSPDPEKNLFALIHAAPDGVTGEAAWYASTCRECPAGCGILAKHREGRVIKLEGNPLHPVNKGRLCIRGQAALQGVYSPRRLKTPLLKEKGVFKPVSYAAAEQIIARRAEDAAAKGKNRVRMLTEVTGECLLNVFDRALEKWKSAKTLVFEPFAYESLKTANLNVFGLYGLPSYHIEKADVLVSFGADFLETWLSPVSYAGKFKEMHALSGGKKGMFIHVGPFRSLTGAASDLWVSCRPGTEGAIALGLVREFAGKGRTPAHPPGFAEKLKAAAALYSKDTVVRMSGISPEQFDILVNAVRGARSPLVLGTGSGTPGDNALQTDMAVNLLNLLLDPELTLLDFHARHRVEIAAPRSDAVEFFEAVAEDPVDLLLIHRSDPAFYLPGRTAVTGVLNRKSLFKVCFTEVMNETAESADLVFPPGHYLETWDEYAGVAGMVSMVQPVTASLYNAPGTGDVFLRAASGGTGGKTPMKAFVHNRLKDRGKIKDRKDWVEVVGRGGVFDAGLPSRSDRHAEVRINPGEKIWEGFSGPREQEANTRFFAVVPGIRFFDGRGGDRSWLSEIPDAMTQVAWQNPVLAHPDTLARDRVRHGEIIRVTTGRGEATFPVYETPLVRPGIYIVSLAGRGFSKKAEPVRQHSLSLLPAETLPVSGGPRCDAPLVQVQGTGAFIRFARTDGSRTQLNRKIALSIPLDRVKGRRDAGLSEKTAGYSMNEFPLTLPLPEGYDAGRDFYPPHAHEKYRWSMIVDLDRCVGCGACMAACYAENNIGVVGEDRIREGREMSWIRIERYHDPDRPENLIFFPMMCQHCDNAPCESVCPVTAPHHSKEGLNNQIYNRCIGTRFCAQNCPYKVRRFNWFEWTWEDPLRLMLNPDVTVRSKGVMEKCSFCIQRIKHAHGRAKDENRGILDGEVVPACVQTCPTGAIVFGNLMDPESRVRKLADDPRAYQAMGYLNTKPAVIYLKKVIPGT